MSNPKECICDPLQANAVQPLQNDILMKDIKECIQYFKKTKDCKYRNPYRSTIEEGRYQLLSIINKIKSQDSRRSSKQSKEDLERSQFLVAMNIEIEKNKVIHLRKEWARQQNALGKVQETLFRKCRLLSLNSNYCSTQGNFLCTPLAALLEKKEVAEFFLNDPEAYLIGFIKIANGCLASYARTYAVEAPFEDSTETGFILALYTCLAHISGLPDGRLLFTQREECHNLLCEILSSLPKMKYCTTDQIKLALLKILHNVVKTKECVKFLWKCAELLPTINKLINQQYCEKYHKLILEVLYTVSKNIPCEECLKKLKKEIDFDRLKEFEEESAVNSIPRKVLKNIDASDRYFDSLKEQAMLKTSYTLPNFKTFDTWSGDSLDKGVQCKEIASCTKCVCSQINQNNLQRPQSDSCICMRTSKPVSTHGICNCDDKQLSQNQTNKSKQVQLIINVAKGEATCTTVSQKGSSHSTKNTSSAAMRTRSKSPTGHNCTNCTCSRKDKNTSRCTSGSDVFLDCEQEPQSSSQKDVTFVCSCDENGSTSLVPWTNEHKANSREDVHKPFQVTNRYIIKGTPKQQKYITRIKIRGLSFEQAPDN